MADLVLKSDSAGSLGMSTHVPSASNFQPWYTQRRPASSLRPKNSEAPRCGQWFWMSRPASAVAEGDQLLAQQQHAQRDRCPATGSSDDSSAGSQYSRISVAHRRARPDAGEQLVVFSVSMSLLQSYCFAFATASRYSLRIWSPAAARQSLTSWS